MRQFIHDVTLNEPLRDSLTFSDSTKIRMLTDPGRPGIRLRGVWDKWEQVLKYPTDTDLTVRLPLWNPGAVKEWRAFEAIASLPEGTSIGYQVSDGTDDYWYNRPSDLLLLAQYNDFAGQTFALDYYRDGSAPGISPQGSPAIVAPGVANFGAGALECAGGGLEGVWYTGAQLGAMKNTGTIRFRVKPNYSGSPTNDQLFLSTVQIAGLKNFVAIGHGSDGFIDLLLADEDGVNIYSGTSVSWSPTAGTWYEWELVWDTTPGSGFGLVLRVGGVSTVSDSSTGERSGAAIDFYGLGTEGVATPNFVLDELQCYDAVQHTADYIPATSEMGTVGWTVAGADDWNTEADVSDNLATFPITDRKLQLIANLRTTDEDVSPILAQYRILIDALYDPWEDFIRTVRQELRTRLRYPKDFSAIKGTTGTTVDLVNDREFVPEENLTIVDILGVWDHDSDPGHDTDLLDSFNVGTQVITLTGSVSAGTRLFIQLQVAPAIKVNFSSADWTEVGKVPAVVIDSMDTDTKETRSILELIDKGQQKGYRLQDSIFHKEIVLSGVLLSGFTTDQFRLHSMLMGGVWANPLVYSVALDVAWSFRIRSPLRWNPRPSLSELRQTSFEAVTSHVHFWMEDVEELPIITNFNYSLVQQADSGPSFTKNPALLAGDIPGFRLTEPPDEP